MSVGILGAGFGLYGYLPAIIVGCRQTAVLPERYRGPFQARAELQGLAPSIRWAPTEEDVLAQVDTLILARRPADQAQQAGSYAARPGIARLLLEKPIAPDPEAAAQLLSQLRESEKTFRIGYNFGLTDWAERLAARTRAGELSEPWSITWDFKAHHYAKDLQNWKRAVSQGGGALRFFGIHVVALLAELGYSDVAYSRITAKREDEAEAWVAEVVGNNVPPCSVRVDSNADAPHFSLVANHQSPDRRTLVQQSDPFDGLPPAGNFDRRVDILTRLCRDLISGTPRYQPWYEGSVRLWSRMEQASQR